jgi:adenylate cyclase
MATGSGLRIGLEVGWVYVGHAGGGGRFVYSIVGDSANTASRVEGLNKHVGTEILATADMVEGFDNLVTRYLGDFQFVGKTSGVPIYEVVALREHIDQRQLRLCEQFEEAIRHYRASDWHRAASALEALLAEFPNDGPAAFFLSRARQFADAPETADEGHIVRMDQK